MPRRKTSNTISDVLNSAENLKNSIAAVPADIQDGIRDLALAIISKPVKRRGRPPKKRVRPKTRVRMPKPRARASWWDFK